MAKIKEASKILRRMEDSAKTPFVVMMDRLSRMQRGVEEGSVDARTLNSVASASRAWMSGIKTALQVAKAASPECKALMDGTNKK